MCDLLATRTELRLFISSYRGDKKKKVSKIEWKKRGGEVDIRDKAERRDFPYQRRFVRKAFLPSSTLPRKQLREVTQEMQHQSTP